MENLNYAEIVSRAARGMDTVKPDWYKWIDKKLLDITNCKRCIFGQTFGGYYEGRHIFLAGLHLSSKQYYSHLSCAFLLPGVEKYWLAEIDARLEADKAKSAEEFIERTTEIINQPVQEDLHV